MPGTINTAKQNSQQHNDAPKLYNSSNICAKLVTTNRDGGRDGEENAPGRAILLAERTKRCLSAVVLSINKPVIIGRNPALWFAYHGIRFDFI
jgi:hypothetical protein